MRREKQLRFTGENASTAREQWITVILRMVFGVAVLAIMVATICLKVRAQETTKLSDAKSKALRESVDDRGDVEPLSAEAQSDETTRADADPQASTQTNPEPKWHYGGFVDVGYLLDFDHPANRVFRGRGTTWHVDRPQINMAAFYVRKKATEDSRWGVELTAQAGKDAELFGFSATAPNLGGYKFLRQLGPTNVSYLASVGKGLTIQGGIFPSFIGYDSLYAKDNFNYTRPWGADFTPYLMMGVNASYPFTKKVTGSFFVVNGYWHLANANHLPSWGGQAAITATSHLTVKQTVLVGPHQADTSFKLWRFLSDTIVEHKTEKRTIAFDANFSTEQVNSPGTPRAWWFAAQAPMRWALTSRWAVALRPEVAWDSKGRWTLARQTVAAITSTIEYKLAYKSSNTILRLEHRFDRSTGPDGGFFRGRTNSLTPNQNLLIFATIFTFER